MTANNSFIAAHYSENAIKPITCDPVKEDNGSVWVLYIAFSLEINFINAMNMLWKNKNIVRLFLNIKQINELFVG